MTIANIGFVGTGAISEAMVRGLLAKPVFASKVVLSPRNTVTALRLASEFGAVEVASSTICLTGFLPALRAVPRRSGACRR